MKEAEALALLEEAKQLGAKHGFYSPYVDESSLWGIAYAIGEVRKAEREACALVCEAGTKHAEDWDSSYWDQACEAMANAIRARACPPASTTLKD